MGISIRGMYFVFLNTFHRRYAVATRAISLQTVSLHELLVKRLCSQVRGDEARRVPVALCEHGESVRQHDDEAHDQSGNRGICCNYVSNRPEKCSLWDSRVQALCHGRRDLGMPCFFIAHINRI